MKRAVLWLLLMLPILRTSAQELYIYVNTLDDLEDPNAGKPNDDGRCDTDPTTPGDQCSFRAAIQNANLKVSSRTFIWFYSIAGPGEPVIEVGSTGLGPLPPVTRQNVSLGPSIDGLPAPWRHVVLDGRMAGPNAIGLQLLAPEGFCEIADLVIRGFSSHGIYIHQSNGNWIYGNIIGADSRANGEQGNGGDGIRIENGSYNEIGRGQAGNVIAGNKGWGIYLRGNALPGEQPAAVYNQIGLHQIGQAPGGEIIPNGMGGIINENAAGTTIGQRAGLFRPGIAIMGTRYGIVVTGARSQDVSIQDAVIGRRGMQPGFNYGIVVKDNASALLINDTLSGNGKGVVIAGRGARAFLDANSIFGNKVLGIDNGNDGVTRNDADDIDAGPNSFQNFPVLQAVRSDSGNTTVYGALNSRPNTVYALQFFSNAACSVLGYGEGESFLGSYQVTTGADGNARFAARLLGVDLPRGRMVTATATDPGKNTSEFSACIGINNSIEDGIVQLGLQVNALRDGHDLTPQQAEVLNAMLGAALRFYIEGYLSAAIAALQVFNATVKFFMYSRFFRRLPVSKGMALIQAAQKIISQISTAPTGPELVMDTGKDHKLAAQETDSGEEGEGIMLKSAPNPFHAATTISFRLPEQARVKLSIFDGQGRQIAILQQAILPAGKHTVQWRPSNLPGGIFLLRLEVNNAGKTIKVMHTD